MEAEINWFWKGYYDYPDNAEFPTQDKFTPEDEAQYIKGWNRARMENTETAYHEPDGTNTWLGNYT